MHSQLETYLSEVAAQLSPLPSKRRNEELREMRAHLENAVTVNRELGQSEDEAAQTAVEWFGTPKVVAEETIASWRRGVRLGRRDFWGAAACAIALPSLVTPLMVWLQTSLPTPAQGFAQPPFSAWLWTEWLFWLMPTFLLTGGISGFLFPKRAVAGVAVGLMVRHAYFLTGGIVHGLWYWSLAVATMDIIFVIFAATAARVGRQWRQSRPSARAASNQALKPG